MQDDDWIAESYPHWLAALDRRLLDGSTGEVGCPDCGGHGGHWWTSEDGRECSERCDTCDGFGTVPATAAAGDAAGG